MAGTKSTTSENKSGLTGLAHAIVNVDEPRDSRDCPHECHGELTVDEEDRVLCETCRCTPDGVYLPPETHESTASGCGLQATFFDPYHGIGPASSDADPKGLRPEVRSKRDSYYDCYPSGAARLAGGYEAVYDEDDEGRPDGVPEDYTFDLSTL